MNSRRKRRRLFELWRKDPRCHWCNCSTVLIFRSPEHCKGLKKIEAREDEATFDHLHSRFDDKRGQNNDGVAKSVLACWKCNFNRGKHEESKRSIDELHKRSQQHRKRNLISG